MSPPTDEQLRLAKDLGGIQAGISNLDRKVDVLSSDVKTLVRREDCASHMDAMRMSVQTAISTATEAGQRAAMAARRAAAARHGFEEVTGELHKPSWWARLVTHSRDLATIITLLGMLTAGLIAMSKIAGRLDQAALVAQHQTPVIVYVPVPVAPDAGRRDR